MRVVKLAPVPPDAPSAIRYPTTRVWLVGIECDSIETPRVHRAARRRDGCVVARPAAGDAGDWKKPLKQWEADHVQVANERSAQTEEDDRAVSAVWLQRCPWDEDGSSGTGDVGFGSGVGIGSGSRRR